MPIILFVFLVTFFLSTPVYPAVSQDAPVYMLPKNCAELLPDTNNFTGFLKAVAVGKVTSDKTFSRRVFRVLALRDKLADHPDRARDENPGDTLIRKTLCYFREQKRPTEAISFDDPEIVTFLREALPQLEKKIDQVVFDLSVEKAQREQFENKLERSRELVEKIQNEAEKEADASYSKLSTAAKKKVKTN